MKQLLLFSVILLSSTITYASPLGDKVRELEKRVEKLEKSQTKFVVIKSKSTVFNDVECESIDSDRSTETLKNVKVKVLKEMICDGRKILLIEHAFRVGGLVPSTQHYTVEKANTISLD